MNESLRQRARRCWAAPAPWDRSFYDEPAPWYCGAVRGAFVAVMKNWKVLIAPLVTIILALLVAIF